MRAASLLFFLAAADHGFSAVDSMAAMFSQQTSAPSDRRELSSYEFKGPLPRVEKLESKIDLFYNFFVKHGYPVEASFIWVTDKCIDTYMMGINSAGAKHKFLNLGNSDARVEPMEELNRSDICGTRAGINGLKQMLHIAGIPRLLMSLWNLLNSYYRHWAVFGIVGAVSFLAVVVAICYHDLLNFFE